MVTGFLLLLAVLNIILTLCPQTEQTKHKLQQEVRAPGTKREQYW